MICDAGNRVCRVLRASSGFAVPSRGGFADLFDQDSKVKALRFLAAVRSKQAAFDWELNARFGATVRLLHFCGAGTEEGVLAVGAESRSGANALLKLLLRGHDIVLTPQPVAEQTLELYERLAEVNNQLVTSQRELERTHAELRRVARERSKLAAMAAHDLRNPLSVVNLCAAAVRTILALPPDSRAGQLLTTITSNTERMVSLINDLLSAFTDDLGAVELKPVSLDIGDLIRDNVRANTLLAAEKEIGIRLDVSDTKSPIRADPSRLHQVFDNLIQNAIKFSPRGSHIDVSVRSSPAAVLVAVQDRGTGMDSETVRAVLAGNARSLRGTELETGFGLGLAISRAIVEKHGGSLSVGSAPHMGSRFEIRLPAQGGS